MTIPAGCVRLKPGVPPRAIERAGLAVFKQLHFAADLYYVLAPDVEVLERAFVTLADVSVYREPEQALVLLPSAARNSIEPDDCREHRRQPYLERMGISKAWAEGFTGSGIAIGVIDGDFDATSLELADAWDSRRSATFRFDTEGIPDLETVGLRRYPAAQYEHGTRCAALAMAARNDVNGTGAAPGSAFVPLALGNLVSPIMAARALAYLADASSEFGGRPRAGCRVVSSSVTEQFVRCDSRVVRDALAFMDARDVLLVTAVSNQAATLDSDYVALHPTVLYTASVNESFERGTPPEPSGPDLCVAQTLGICGTTLRDEWVSLNGGNSWSAPVVAGVAALVRQVHPGMTAAQVRERILSTCEPVGSSAVVGRGLVRADRAIR